MHDKIPGTAARSLVDGSLLMVEAAAQAGVDSFVGYPITPANLLYLYSSKRFPLVLPATDEISTLQWMSGLSAAGKMPMTATSYPGLALMLESIGMAFMMELPMLIILAQRLGPATGSATCNAQGDLLLLRGINSGGYPVPVFCPSSLDACWTMAAKAVETAQALRTPTVLLTSKEMAMTLRDWDLASLPILNKCGRKTWQGPGAYLPYSAAKEGAPDFLPLGSGSARVRLTASTHDQKGDLQHSSPEALANTARLYDKIVGNLRSYTEFEYLPGGGDTLVIAFDVTAEAARDAADILARMGRPVSLLLPGTIFPVPPEYLEIASKYRRVVVAEENHDGQYRKILFGEAGRPGVSGTNAVGRMISPQDIVEEALR